MMTSRVRSTSRRRRGLTLVAAVALVGAPLLAGSPAGADAAGTVTFSGGCGLLGSGLGASSHPDTAQVSLPSGTQLRFTNQLGQAATLRLDGQEAAEIPDGGSADVIFHDGPVEATMQISCLLGTPAGAVTVEVSPAPQPARPSPSASSPGGAPPGTGAGSTGGSRADAGSGTSSPGGSPDGGWWASGPGGPADQPAGADGEASDGPAPAGLPGPTGELSQRWGLATDPASGGGSSTDPANVDAQAADRQPASQELARTSGSAPGDGPVGLLALIATVCVVGVSAGAVRALLSQRAVRTG